MALFETLHGMRARVPSGDCGNDEQHGVLFQSGIERGLSLARGPCRVDQVVQRKIPRRDTTPERRVGGEIWGATHLAKTLSNIPHGHTVDAGQTPSVFGSPGFFHDRPLGTCLILKWIHLDLVLQHIKKYVIVEQHRTFFSFCFFAFFAFFQPANKRQLL